MNNNKKGSGQAGPLFDLRSETSPFIQPTVVLPSSPPPPSPPLPSPPLLLCFHMDNYHSSCTTPGVEKVPREECTRSGKLRTLLVQIPVFQEPVFKREVFLLPLAPVLIVEVDICALFIFICDCLWLFVPLKPHHVLCMESPRLLFESFCCQVLGFRSLHVIKYKEESFGRQPLKEVYCI